RRALVRVRFAALAVGFSTVRRALSAPLFPYTTLFRSSVSAGATSGGSARPSSRRISSVPTLPRLMSSGSVLRAALPADRQGWRDLLEGAQALPVPDRVDHDVHQRLDDCPSACKRGCLPPGPGVIGGCDLGQRVF